MSPSPEKIEGQKPAARQSPACSEEPLTRGLQMKARLTAPTWEIGLSAVVYDCTPGEVILLLDDEIAAGTRVTVQLNTSSFVGDIVFCKPSGTRYEAHVSFEDLDAIGMRRTPRFPVNIPARIFTSASDGPMDAKIVDVSGEGVGIELPSAIPLQSSIVVQSEENTALGEVRHCRQLSSGRFRAGVQLHHILKKDPDLAKASGWMDKLGARLGGKKA